VRRKIGRGEERINKEPQLVSNEAFTTKIQSVQEISSPSQQNKVPQVITPSRQEVKTHYYEKKRGSSSSQSLVGVASSPQHL
jgi:hypothetical protein